MEFKIGTESISKIMAGTTEITDFIVPEPTPEPTPVTPPLLEINNGNLTVNKGGLLFTTVYSSGGTSYSMDPYEGDTATITDFVNVQDTLINAEDNNNRMYLDKYMSLSRYPGTEQEILASPETFGYIYADANKNITSSGIILNPNYGVITENQGE